MKPSRTLVLGLFVFWAGGVNAESHSVVVNECSAGSRGWIELYNSSSVPRELARDKNWCWLVDDSDGAGTPKIITDDNVNHPAGSTTCTAAKRGARCGVIGPKEHVWVGYAYVNGATPDACRLLTSVRSGARCDAKAQDIAVGGATTGAGANACFGRTPDAAGWADATLNCSQGSANVACTSGATCEDGNLCTTGEKFDASCGCRGGAPTTGASCGAGRVCQSGVCTATNAQTPPVIERPGKDGVLLAGTIVTPASVLEGEVLVVGEDIACVAASCQSHPMAAKAAYVQTNGIIFPGLIDLHNHVQFDIFDESDWSPEATDEFTNHEQWPRRARYKALVDTKQYLNGEAGSPVNIGCELLKYGEMKGLVGGTTAMVGAPIPSNQKCFGSLVRSIDQSSNGLPADKVQTATPFPSQSSADGVCRNLNSGTTDSYLIHIAEGVDERAHEEFEKMVDVTTEKGCLLSPKTTIVHGTALSELDFDVMAAHGMGLVWSPRSNVFLYGHGTDLSQTANIPAALDRGLRVALAPDWSIGGSQNLLDELRFADKVDNQQWSDAINPKQLVEMVTSIPAKLLGLDATLGSIAVGHKADLVIISGNRAAPYESLLAATPRNVRLVMVGGKPLYGEPPLKELSNEPHCESLDICGSSKFACIATSSTSSRDKLDQTYAQVVQTIETELTHYDAKNLSQWDFSPIAALYRCN